MQTLRSRKESLKPHDQRPSASKTGEDKPKVRSRPQPFFAAIFGFLVFLFFFLLSHHEKKQGATVGGSSRKTLRRKSHKKATGGEISREMLKSKSLFKATAKQVEKRDMKGGVVFKSITSVKKEDLKGLVDNLPENIESISYEEAIKGREKLVDILHDAGVEDMDIASIMSLPMWETVQRLYGDGPVLVGLDTCERFRETIPVNDASIGIAGMFNTGTNPFNMYLEANCIMPQNKREAHGGMRWQVPWGKHTPVSRKWSHTAGHEGKVNKTNVLPVAIVRDPYSWMQSMCNHPYAAKWYRSKQHCPNLVPNARESSDTASFGVTVNYDPPAKYDSLAEYWVTWYKEYLEADYPRLIVRFEDLQFHAKEMVDLICQCAGGEARNDGEFTYIVDSGKWGAAHGAKPQRTNLITAMIKYGSDKNRFTSLTKEDLEYASKVLDPELMELFQYEIPSL